MSTDVTVLVGGGDSRADASKPDGKPDGSEHQQPPYSSYPYNQQSAAAPPAYNVYNPGPSAYSFNGNTYPPTAGVIQTQPVMIVYPHSPHELAGIKDYTTCAWLTCLFCCWPFGLLAIIYSNHVRHAKMIGNVADARANSMLAYRWSVAAFACGIVLLTGACAYLVLFSMNIAYHYH